MQRHHRRLLIAGAPLLLLSCGHADAPTDATFQSALQTWLDAHPVCVTLTVRFPYDLRLKGREDARRRFDALAEAGLLSADPLREQETDLRGGAVAVDHLRYRVTDAGAAVLHPVDASGADNSNLCFARKRVTAIKGNTPPTDALGIRSSRVTYDWTLDRVAPWASSSAVRESWPAIAAALRRSGGESTETLVRTDAGWQRRDGGTKP